MVRVILLLVIAAGVIIFAFQNLSPIGLVVLGIKTQPLPLSVWVIGALTAGALTTLVLSGFSSISKSFAVRRSTQRPTESSAKPPKSPWSGMGMKSGDATRTARAQNTAGFRAARSDQRTAESRRNDEDWDTPSSNDWDDWEEPASPRRSSTSAQTPMRDTQNDDWTKWDDNEPSIRDTRRSPQPDPSRRIDLGPHPGSRSSATTNNAQRSTSQETTHKADNVYDAEYRVLIPPYNPTPEPPVPNPTSSAADDEDWGLDDDFEDKTDRDKR